MRIPYFRPVSRKGGNTGFLWGFRLPFWQILRNAVPSGVYFVRCGSFSSGGHRTCFYGGNGGRRVPLANVNATGKAIHIPAGPPWNVEAQQIAQRQGNDNVAQERVTHERAYVGNAS